MTAGPDTGKAGGRDVPAAVTPNPRSRAAVVVIGFITLFVCLVVFGLLAEDVHAQEAFALDAVMTPLLHSFASPTLDSVMWAVTTLASTMVVAPLFVIAELLLVWARRWREALFLAVATLGSVLINAAMKLVIQRPRPILPWAQAPLDYSFPSGHTMNGLVFYLALALVIWVIFGPRVGAVAVVAATILGVLVAISRIYLGAHYFTDVVGGFLAGIAWLLIVSAAFDLGDRLATWRSRRAQPPSPSASPPAPPAVST